MLVPLAGLEPARSYDLGILSPLRLPFRHSGGARDNLRISSPHSNSAIAEPPTYQRTLSGKNS